MHVCFYLRTVRYSYIRTSVLRTVASLIAGVWPSPLPSRMPLFQVDTALPSVNTLGECADFAETVAPFLPQFGSLPEQVWQSWTDLESLKHLYLSTNPVVAAFALATALSPIFLVLSEVNRNFSQIDRAWSVLPTVFVAHFTAYAHLSGLPTERLDTLLIASFIWSVSRGCIQWHVK